MQDERDDQETSKADPFEGIDEIGTEGAFQAWELQTQSIATIGSLYLKLIEIGSPDSVEVTHAVGHALIAIVEDWRPRNVAIMAAAVATGQNVEPRS